MLIKEYGQENKPTILIPPGMMADYQAVRHLLRGLESNYRTLYPVYDGLYPGSADFTSFADQARQIEDYVQDHYQGHLDYAYGASQGGLMLVEILTRGQITIDRVFMDGVYVAHQGKLAGWLATKCFVMMKKNQGIPNVLKPIMQLTTKLMGLDLDEASKMIKNFIYWEASEETVRRNAMQNYTYVTRPAIKETESFVCLCCGDKEPYAKKSHEELKQYLRNYEEKIIPNVGHGELLTKDPDRLIELMVEFFEADGE